MSANDGIGLSAAAESTTATAATKATATAIIRGASGAPTAQAALRLIGIALFQMILLVVD